MLNATDDRISRSGAFWVLQDISIFSAKLFCHPFGGRDSLDNQEYPKKPPTSHDLR